MSDNFSIAILVNVQIDSLANLFRIFEGTNNIFVECTQIVCHYFAHFSTFCLFKDLEEVFCQNSFYTHKY